MTKKNILIVDDEFDTRDLFERALTRKEHYNVFLAKNSEEADLIMKSEKIHLAVIDFVLDKGCGISGSDLATRYREIYPEIILILISGNPDRLYRTDAPVDTFLEKPIELSYLEKIISHHFYLKKTKKEYSAMFSKWPGITSIKKPLRLTPPPLEKEKYQSSADLFFLETLSGICQFDGKRIRWDVYRLPEHENQSTIGVVSSIGCLGKCRFCLSCTRPFVRNLRQDEIVCQVYYGLLSPLVNIKDKNHKITVNFTGEGDALVTNLFNSVRAIENMADTAGLNLNFIITTIGSVNALKWLVKKEMYLCLKNTELYWSVNSLDQKKQNYLMPLTKKSWYNLEKLKLSFDEIGNLLGRPTTLSWALIEDVNDDLQSAREIVKFLKDTNLRVKLQLFDDSKNKTLTSSIIEKAQKMEKYIKNHGIDCRLRTVIGGDFFSGCGTTVPIMHSPKLGDIKNFEQYSDYARVVGPSKGIW